MDVGAGAGESVGLGVGGVTGGIEVEIEAGVGTETLAVGARVEWERLADEN